MDETQEQRGRDHLSRLLAASYDLSKKGASDPKKWIDTSRIQMDLRAASHWINAVKVAQERLSAELTAYRSALSELHTSMEARLVDYASEPSQRTRLSQRLDVDLARAREILEAYDPAVARQ